MNTTSKPFPLSPDEVQLAILIQLGQQTELLTVLCQHQDDEVQRQVRSRSALPSPFRTAKPMPNPPPPQYDWSTGAVRGCMSEESLKAEFARRGPVATDDTQALLLAELRGLRADLRRRHVEITSPAMRTTSDRDLSTLPPPPGAGPGYWMSAVGIREPMWIASPPRAHTPPPATSTGSGSKDTSEPQS